MIVDIVRHCEKEQRYLQMIYSDIRGAQEDVEMPNDDNSKESVVAVNAAANF